MLELLEPVGVVCLASLGVLLGYAFSRLKSKAWLLGYVIPFAVVLLLVLARRIPRLSWTPPFSWLMAGRLEFALLGAGAAMLLTTPLSRLKSARMRQLIVIFIAVVVAKFSVLPFVEPLMMRSHFARLRTQFDEHGVCLQSTSCTCGPAAAVTALEMLGLHGTESELAILAHTSVSAGTPADLLCAALRKRYGAQGLTCEYRFFDSVDELRDTGVVLAEIRLSPLIDHWVAIRKVTDEAVDLADPLGRRVVPREMFADMWRYTGIVLKRKQEEEK